MNTVLTLGTWRRQLPRGRRIPLPAWRLPARCNGLRRLDRFHALIAALAVAAFLSGPWFSNRPSSAAAGASTAVIEGDSLHAAYVDIRLIGIDAPGLRQTCIESGGQSWPCGQAAREHLRTLVAGGDIACTVQGQDGYRAIAICSADGVADLGEAMVRDGYAVDASGFTKRYAAAEAEARAQRRGIWQGSVAHPRPWRAAQRPHATAGWNRPQ